MLIQIVLCSRDISRCRIDEHNMLPVKSITRGDYPRVFAEAARILDPKYDENIEGQLRNGFPTGIEGDPAEEHRWPERRAPPNTIPRVPRPVCLAAWISTCVE